VGALPNTSTDDSVNWLLLIGLLGIAGASARLAIRPR
jgi:LPXTG-motif cell wall-anchored protein